MAEIKEIIGSICTGLGATLGECGFSPVYPAGADKSVLPVIAEDGGAYIEYKGENKAIKIEHRNGMIILYGANKEGEILSSDYTELTRSLFETEVKDDDGNMVEAGEEFLRKNINYTVNDFSDTLVETFGTKTKKPVKSKLPTPVSKAAAKSGAVSYDPNTLANRFTTIYPQLRDEYKANIEKYGEFLPETFFVNFGNKVVLDTIKKNNPSEMKRLFKLFNEIYEDGTNDTQSLIAVTILGSLENDQELLASCVDYMSQDLTVNVINVNKFLWSKGGKGSRMKLENPPRYKPQKKKKSKITSSLGM